VSTSIPTDINYLSGYEVYDRLSPSFAKYLETLTAAHEAHFFRDAAIAFGHTVRDQVRGSPGNFGDALEAVHPVIRCVLLTVNGKYDLTHVPAWLRKYKSSNWMEECVCEPRIHEAYYWCDKGRVGYHFEVSFPLDIWGKYQRSN
jgi:hypothetical protein